ncbi:hypothetical protein BvCmsKSNP081_02520 [Escherichia coli]|nr:hypothetical protein BvCmsKSNP081_02520 [Escherichia coli]GDL80348.1 hypothetical protein BvCmsKSNP073_03728 [Escherichia coli]
MGELFTGVQGEDISGSLCSVKLCVLHIHADTVALRLRSGRGLQTVAFYRHRATRTGFTRQCGRRAVQHEVTVTVCDRFFCGGQCVCRSHKFLCPGEGTAVVYLRGTERQHVIADESAAVFECTADGNAGTAFCTGITGQCGIAGADIECAATFNTAGAGQVSGCDFQAVPLDGTGITECPGFHRGIAPGNQCPAVVQAAGADGECFPGNAAAFQCGIPRGGKGDIFSCIHGPGSLVQVLCTEHGVLSGSQFTTVLYNLPG